VKTRETVLKIFAAVGAAIAYGFLAAFLFLVGWQTYHWFRDGEWTHVGTSDGLHVALLRCCVKDGDFGSFASLLRWVDAPVSWLGVHKIAEVIPASLALFAVSIAGNFLFIYCRDRLARRGASPVRVS
jgi:mannose/fructose/N-acetylgalactosamine-specific phosphotransferase system component IID